ncbi:MAG: helix-turn-helix domain-containing protein [Prevotellaceae bacterium]|nr:helix-turn-helix domain-containing protein [Prevotellaceae bacterium]
MKSTELEPLMFSESLSDLESMYATGNVVHVLCVGGSFSFTVNRIHYKVCECDYIIFAVGVLFSNVECSSDCRVLLMSFPESMTSATVFNSNYGILGHLALLTNPVIHLSKIEFDACRKDLIRLRERTTFRHHLFHYEMIATLLKAHILDLYDIHARSCKSINPESRIAELMNKFIRMLIEGDFLTDRSLEYYAGKLCITPHYLSEISKKTSGQPATYWINQFFLKEAIRQVSDKKLSMENITLRLNISSVSYLTRYLKKQLGMTPSELRKGIK